MVSVATEQSKALFERAQAVMPGGNTRHTVHFSPYPVYAARGAGCRVTDVDGTERIDFVNNYSSQIHGHCHPAIVDAIRRQAGQLQAVGLPTESEIALAELLVARLPAVDQIRFCNSGTEAVMFAIRAARAYTRRPKIAKVEGAYHGAYDTAETSMDSMPDNWGSPEPVAVGHARNTPAKLLDDVVVMPFNDVEASRRILRQQGAEIAAILFDPVVSRMGFLEITPEYRDFLHQMRREIGCLLIVDEVFTFRVAYDGGQGRYGIDADLTALGKIIGGGLPIGAVGGKAEIMKMFDGSTGHPAVPHGGTFNANPLAMVAGLVSMELLTRQEIARLNGLGQRFRDGTARILARLELPGRPIGTASMAGILLSDRQYTEYRGFLPAMVDSLPALLRLHAAMLAEGVLFIPHGGFIMSTAMQDADIDFALAKLELCLPNAVRGQA
jgi:glutamate-1-semialdehyde 2,1-aminomutase